MTQDEQADLLKRHYALNALGNHAEARELLTDDFVIIVPAFMPFGGVYRGKDAFLELIPKVREMAAVVAIKPVATSFGSDHAVEIVEFILRGHDGPPPQVAELVRFEGDRICEIRPFYSDPHPFMAVTARQD